MPFRIYEIEGFRFERKHDHRIVVEVSPRTEEVRQRVVRLYEQRATTTRTLFRGEWKWCSNPNCNNLVYFPQKHLRRRARTCSQRCWQATRKKNSSVPKKIPIPQHEFTFESGEIWMRMKANRPVALEQAIREIGDRFEILKEEEGRSIFVKVMSRHEELRELLSRVGRVITRN